MPTPGLVGTEGGNNGSGGLNRCTAANAPSLAPRGFPPPLPGRGLCLHHPQLQLWETTIAAWEPFQDKSGDFEKPFEQQKAQEPYFLWGLTAQWLLYLGNKARRVVLGKNLCGACAVCVSVSAWAQSCPLLPALPDRLADLDAWALHRSPPFPSPPAGRRRFLSTLF